MINFLLYIRMVVAVLGFLAIMPTFYLRTPRPATKTQYMKDKAGTLYFILTSPVWITAIAILELTDPENWCFERIS